MLTNLETANSNKFSQVYLVRFIYFFVKNNLIGLKITTFRNCLKPTAIFFRGEHAITFDAPTTEAQEWDLYQRGPRIFLFRQESF